MCRYDERGIFLFTASSLQPLRDIHLLYVCTQLSPSVCMPPSLTAALRSSLFPPAASQLCVHSQKVHPPVCFQLFLLLPPPPLVFLSPPLPVSVECTATPAGRETPLYQQICRYRPPRLDRNISMTVNESWNHLDFSPG